MFGERMVTRPLLTLSAIPGWTLYAVGAAELIWEWPFDRVVGLVTIALGVVDHARVMRGARRRLT
jgi:hypothetical protein